MDADDPPTAWEREVHETRTGTFVDHVHVSGDVRVRIAPPTDASDGHAITATLFPHTDLEETYDVRRVAARERAERIARQFADLFDGVYGGPGGGDGSRPLEDAVAYALERTRPSGAVDVDLPARER
ncbi:MULTISPECIES: hypothetical protein [Halostella]|uniref:hypothetical protein n=1 Tax=Halostella TaxID=1843185 RepID=UPI00187832A1|nr:MULTISPECIES: hypothetical protein [Halostella]